MALAPIAASFRSTEAGTTAAPVHPAATAVPAFGGETLAMATKSTGAIPAVALGNDRRIDAFLRAGVEGDVDTLKRLMAEGVDVNAANAYGYTALHYAAGNGRLEAMQLLLDAGANVHAVCQPFGRTVLMQAAGRGGADAVKLVLTAGPRLEDRDNDGRTALMVAALAGDKDAAFALVEAGADARATDTHGAKASELAAELGHNWVASLLRGAEKLPRPVQH